MAVRAALGSPAGKGSSLERSVRSDLAGLGAGPRSPLPKTSEIPLGRALPILRIAADAAPSEASRVPAETSAGGSAQARRGRFRFEGGEIDSAERELRRGSGRLQLAPKPFELLLLLLANRHRSLSRAEILERVWHGVHVSEATLASTLRDLRRALGDEGRQSHLIRTIRGVGLRFIAPVEEVPLPPDGEERPGFFVGREAPLGRLQAALAAAWQGRSAVVLIAG